MATVVSTTLDVLLIALRDRIMTKLDFPPERVLITARDKLPFHPQADQYVVIRDPDMHQNTETLHGHGRIENRVLQRVPVWLRTRLATDEITQDLLWLTDQSLGHIHMRHTLYDALQTWLPEDDDGNALCYQPMTVTFGSRGDKDTTNEDWGESRLEVVLPYIMKLDQSYQ